LILSDLESSKVPKHAAVIPLPKEETTPPVTNTYLVMPSANLKLPEQILQFETLQKLLWS